MNIARVDEVRAAEERTIAGGTAGYELMRRAAKEAAQVIQEFYPSPRKSLLLCGGGNNGGDALALAGMLPGEVIVYTARNLSEYKDAASCAAADLPAHISVHPLNALSAAVLTPGTLVIDGLLGIGFKGPEVRKEVADCIALVNASACFIAALDVPSGLNSDTGECSSATIRADLTITFGAVKAGLLLKQGPEYCGILRCADIGLGKVSADNRAVTFEEALAFRPRKPADLHKNRRGELMICAGSRDYTGAAALTAEAALRCGAGLVRLATTNPRANLPHALIVRKIEAPRGTLDPQIWSQCADWLQCSTALAAGPGWGNGEPALLAGALQYSGPLVLDADALNLLARYPQLWQKRPQTILTPHPGEARRLAKAFGIEAEDRETLARKLAQKLGAVIVLKGKFTQISAPDGRESVILSGAPALATAGSGDVLTGIIGALLAGGQDPFEAAVLGTSLHGRAGEISGNGTIADDLPLVLKHILESLPL